MDMKLDSTAPYIKKASTREEDFLDWGDHLEPVDGKSSNFGRLLWREDHDETSEAGIWNATPGSWHLVTPRDELHHFVRGKATYTSDDGEVIEASVGTVIHFKEGWSGTVIVKETVRTIYMMR